MSTTRPRHVVQHALHTSRSSQADNANGTTIIHSNKLSSPVDVHCSMRQSSTRTPSRRHKSTTPIPPFAAGDRRRYTLDARCHRGLRQRHRRTMLALRTALVHCSYSDTAADRTAVRQGNPLLAGMEVYSTGTATGRTNRRRIESLSHSTRRNLHRWLTPCKWLSPESSSQRWCKQSIEARATRYRQCARGNGRS